MENEGDHANVEVLLISLSFMAGRITRVRGLYVFDSSSDKHAHIIISPLP